MGTEVQDRFTYRQPTAEQVTSIDEARHRLRFVAEWLQAIPMDPRCRALALTKLEEVSMWANKGIVFHGQSDEPPEQIFLEPAR